MGCCRSTSKSQHLSSTQDKKEEEEEENPHWAGDEWRGAPGPLEELRM